MLMPVRQSVLSSANNFTLIAVWVQLLKTYRTQATASLRTKSTLIFKLLVPLQEGGSVLAIISPAQMSCQAQSVCSV